MNDEEMRIAIAEACGYSPCPLFSNPAWSREPTGLQPPFYFELPDYLNDLNAMHEAEKVLDAGQWDDYHQHLIEQVRGKGPHPRDISVCHATARQRAIAFIKTLNLEPK